ncbi:major facilitator family transporter [Streptomyces himastatinicus ATCC 53653]|uniref:Major facilitator family transporter n=1 Tax=Streptomyces himastatinicus ATCC 53653 TaxID=457427 RepID=D9W9D5_9ACTN|nr:MFS transporter [Streptomyces himastatinicus]EFL20623.1 major facilitator family transporter [Streptomyces himastatinicus ATCC 53653]
MSASLPGPATRRALLAGSVGNFIEWYEFGVYGFFATVIAANFFTPEGGSAIEGLVKTYASFGLAFFFRPIGAAAFGRVGDRIGRRPTLILVLLLMTGATTLIGVLPTYDTVGAAAPWLLTLVRILQGLSAGGEFGGAVSLMTEFAPPGRRGLYGAWQSFTVALGLLAGAGTAAVLATALSEAALNDWGWRLPFLLALPLGLTALWLRLRLEETPSFRTTGAQAAPSEAGATRRETAGAIVLGSGRIMGWAAAGYTFLVVMPSYLQATLDATFQQALIATVVANAGFAAAILPAGLLSDRIGRRPVMLTGAALVTVLAFPLLNVLQDPDSSALVQGLAVLVAGAVVGLMAGPGPAMLAEMFPTRVRYTGLGLAYALSNAVFSGCAGLIITEAVKRTGEADIPAYYVAATGALSVIALATLRGDTHRGTLREEERHPPRDETEEETPCA